MISYHKTVLMKIKILLVYPKNYHIGISDVSRNPIFFGKESGGCPNLSLATIATLTPDEFHIKIVDENIEEIDFEEPFHIVGITAFLSQIDRSRIIATEFSKRGSLIVCGGSSVSLDPEKWKKIADVLIVGEAERIWPEFLKDYTKGIHKKIYKEDRKIDLSETPLPSYKYFSKNSLKKYLWGAVQTSRGCIHHCEFCTVGKLNGFKMRYKPINKIIDEIDQLCKLGLGNTIFLVDDNFSGDLNKAKAILKAIRSWNNKKRYQTIFYTQISLNAAEDDEFLRLAAEAGLLKVMIGIETPNYESLNETRKYQNIKYDIEKNCKKFNEYGIQVICNCIVGFDHDDLRIFKQQFDYLMSGGSSNIIIHPLHALDNSALKFRMIRENRYVQWQSSGSNAERTFFNTQTYIPKNMKFDQLIQGTFWLFRELYKPENLVIRLQNFFKNYESSEMRLSLVMPVRKIDYTSILIALRLIKYTILKAPLSDIRRLKEMLSVTIRSTHPHRFLIFIENILLLFNTNQILRKACPNINSLEYPV